MERGVVRTSNDGRLSCRTQTAKSRREPGTGNTGFSYIFAVWGLLQYPCVPARLGLREYMLCPWCVQFGICYKILVLPMASATVCSLFGTCCAILLLLPMVSAIVCSLVLAAGSFGCQQEATKRGSRIYSEPEAENLFRDKGGIASMMPTRPACHAKRDDLRSHSTRRLALAPCTCTGPLHMQCNIPRQTPS